MLRDLLARGVRCLVRVVFFFPGRRSLAWRLVFSQSSGCRPHLGVSWPRGSTRHSFEDGVFDGSRTRVCRQPTPSTFEENLARVARLRRKWSCILRFSPRRREGCREEASGMLLGRVGGAVTWTLAQETGSPVGRSRPLVSSMCTWSPAGLCVCRGNEVCHGDERCVFSRCTKLRCWKPVRIRWRRLECPPR